MKKYLFIILGLGLFLILPKFSLADETATDTRYRFTAPFTTPTISFSGDSYENIDIGTSSEAITTGSNGGTGLWLEVQAVDSGGASACDVSNPYILYGTQENSWDAGYSISGGGFFVGQTAWGTCLYDNVPGQNGYGDPSVDLGEVVGFQFTHGDQGVDKIVGLGSRYSTNNISPISYGYLSNATPTYPQAPFTFPNFKFLVVENGTTTSNFQSWQIYQDKAENLTVPYLANVIYWQGTSTIPVSPIYNDCLYACVGALVPGEGVLPFTGTSTIPILKKNIPDFAVFGSTSTWTAEFTLGNASSTFVLATTTFYFDSGTPTPIICNGTVCENAPGYGQTPGQGITFHNPTTADCPLPGGFTDIGGGVYWALCNTLDLIFNPAKAPLPQSYFFDQVQGIENVAPFVQFFKTANAVTSTLANFSSSTNMDGVSIGILGFPNQQQTNLVTLNSTTFGQFNQATTTEAINFMGGYINAWLWIGAGIKLIYIFIT